MPNKSILEIIPKPIEETHDKVRIAFLVKDTTLNQSDEYFYELPVEYAHTITELSDPFLLSMLMKAMRAKQDIYVRGKVSRTLIRHLNEYQVAWSAWLPQYFSPVKIVVEHEIDNQQVTPSQKGYVSGFSGGVDASFTLWDNLLNPDNKYPYPIKAAMLVHGFDIDIAEKEGFARTYEKAKQMTDDVGIALIPVVTNTKQHPWYYMCGAALAACLHVVAGGYEGALIASTDPYSVIENHFSGTNPTTDHLLARDGFSIIHYGATHSRMMKIDCINNWKLVRQNLRVCWQSNSSQNCGKCEKCIRTILGFRVNGHSLPECFPHEISDAQIRKLWLGSRGAVIEMELILKEAKKRNIKESWVAALEFCVMKGKIASHIKEEYFGGVTPPILKKLLKI